MAKKSASQIREEWLRKVREATGLKPRQTSSEPLSSPQPEMNAHDLNKSELSQRCLKALQDLKVPVDPQGPYSLQLLEWALDNLKLEGPWAHFQYDLLEQVQGMWGWKHVDPESLLVDEEGNAPEETSPESLALDLLENLYENLRRKLPGLR